MRATTANPYALSPQMTYNLQRILVHERSSSLAPAWLVLPVQQAEALERRGLVTCRLGSQAYGADCCLTGEGRTVAAWTP